MPSRPTSFTTTRSRCLALSFLSPAASEIGRLGGEPDQHARCPCARRARRGCRASARDGDPERRPPSSACPRRRPSAGSRRPRRPSRRREPRQRRARTARCISSAVSTRTMPTPSGGATVLGTEDHRTSAPRDAASAATATPILPVERFPMKRTGSIGSWVGPAVTTIRTPSRSRSPVSERTTAWKISSRLGHPAEALVAGGQRPDDRTDEQGTALDERRDVRGRRGMLPHAGVHRGGEHQRARRLEQRRREQVVGDPRRQLREHVGGNRRDDGDVDVVCQAARARPRRGCPRARSGPDGR